MLGSGRGSSYGNMARNEALLREAEEVDRSSIHFPFTRVGTIVVWVVSTLFFVVLIGGIEICQAADACDRDSWDPDHWGVFRNTDPWCEESRLDRMIVQPMNGYSNLWFCYCGSWIFAMGVADFIRNRRKERTTPRNHLLDAPYLSISYAVGLWFAGIGSFCYHSYDTEYTHFLDIAGANVLLMNIGLLSFLPLVNLELRLALLTSVRIIVAIGGAIVGIIITYEVADQFWMIPGIVLASFFGQSVHISLRMAPALLGRDFNIFSENQIAWEIRKPSLGIVSILLGIVAMLFGETLVEVPCEPYSLWQFHAAWHGFISSAATVYYLYLRTEHLDYRSDLNDVLKEDLMERSKHMFCIVCGQPYLFASAARNVDDLTTHKPDL